MRRANMGKPNTISIKVPAWIDEARIKDGVEKLLEEEYGVVSVDSLRRRFKVKLLREDVYVNERETLALREAEKKRLKSP